MIEKYYPPEAYHLAEMRKDYHEGRWCGECRWGVVEDPPCCFRPEPCGYCHRRPPVGGWFAATGEGVPICPTCAA